MFDPKVYIQEVYSPRLVTFVEAGIVWPIVTTAESPEGLL